MTDRSALIERLEEQVAYDKRHFTVDPLHAEAAAALRDQQRRLDLWEPKPFCGASWSSSTLPSAPNQAKEEE